MEGSKPGAFAPKALVEARRLAHHAAQWPTRAARANLAAVPDDRHSSLIWDPAQAALLSRPFGAARVGLRVADLALLFLHGGEVETFALDGQSDARANAWLDARLAAAGLKPASGARLPYKLKAAPVRLSVTGELKELARWFAVSADVLEALKNRLAAGPVLCWPHHFDIAMVVELGESRSVGMGVSPGDEHYAQPYAYVSPYPRPDPAALAPLPAGGAWHTSGFLGAVMLGDAMLARGDARAALLAFLAGSFEACRKMLTGGR